MSSAPDPTRDLSLETGPDDDRSDARIQQVLDAVEAAGVTPEDALRISLELLGFVEEYHLEVLEELLGEAESEPISVAVWAADSARLKTARSLLEEVLGDDEDDAEAGDDDDEAWEDGLDSEEPDAAAVVEP